MWGREGPREKDGQKVGVGVRRGQHQLCLLHGPASCFSVPGGAGRPRRGPGDVLEGGADHLHRLRSALSPRALPPRRRILHGFVR